MSMHNAEAGLFLQALIIFYNWIDNFIKRKDVNYTGKDINVKGKHNYII
ncbi:hypothetical protein ACT3CD_07840 [Geofilum sp. OHC36d9]